MAERQPSAREKQKKLAGSKTDYKDLIPSGFAGYTVSIQTDVFGDILSPPFFCGSLTVAD